MEKYIRYNPSIGQIYTDIFDFFKISNDGSVIINIDSNCKNNDNIIIPYQINYPFLKSNDIFYKSLLEFNKIESEYKNKFNDSVIIYIIDGFIGEDEKIKITIKTNSPERALYYKNLIIKKNETLKLKEPILELIIYDFKYDYFKNYLNYNTHEIYFFDKNIFNFKNVILYYLSNLKLYYCNFVNSYQILANNSILNKITKSYENIIYIKTLILNELDRKYILSGNKFLLHYIQNKFIYTHKFDNKITKLSTGFCSINVKERTLNNLFNCEDYFVSEIKHCKNLTKFLKYNCLLQNVKYNNELDKIFYNNITTNYTSKISIGSNANPNLSEFNIDLRFNNFYFFIETNNCLLCNKINVDHHLLAKIILLGLNKVKFINNEINLLYNDDYLCIDNNLDYCKFNDKKILYNQLVSVLFKKKCYLIFSKLYFKNHSRRFSRRSTDDFIQVEVSNENYNSFDEFINKKNFRNKNYTEEYFKTMFDKLDNIIVKDFDKYLIE